MSEETGLDSWFLHEKLVLSLLSERDATALTRRVPGPEHPFALAMRIDLFERALATYLAHNDVSSLEVEHLRGRLKQGQLVWLEQTIAFKGVGAALKVVERGGNGRASFSARLATDKEVRASGTYNAARLTGGTAGSQLSGTKRQFVLGYVQTITTDEIELRPIVIAQRWLRPTPEIAFRHSDDPAHVWPSTVDQFAGVDFKQRLKKADLNVLKDIPETVVKNSFADILGEPDVPKDWGGEHYDLWTNDRLSVEGQPLRTAFLFKGPAKFEPMMIKHLGKNGDQIDRLSHYPADLMVVQHCHSITTQVVNMLKNYASNPQNPRRYMTLDGYNTVKILRHFGKIG
ncbi:MAG: hypothetical protein WCF33_11700 [Pseudonocardiaceae bacterium]